MTRCRAESFYLSPGDKRPFAQWRVSAVDAAGRVQEITHRNDVRRLTGGALGVLLPVTVTHKETGVVEEHLLDARLVEGHLPVDARGWALHPLTRAGDGDALRAALEAPGSLRRFAELLYGRPADGGAATAPVVKAIGALAQAPGRAAHTTAALAFTAAAASWLDPDKVAALLTHTAATGRAYRPVDPAALSRDLGAVLECYPAARRQRLLADLWTLAHDGEWWNALDAGAELTDPFYDDAYDYDDYDDYDDYGDPGDYDALNPATSPYVLAEHDPKTGQVTWALVPDAQAHTLGPDAFQNWCLERVPTQGPQQGEEAFGLDLSACTDAQLVDLAVALAWPGGTHRVRLDARALRLARESLPPADFGRLLTRQGDLAGPALAALAGDPDPVVGAVAAALAVTTAEELAAVVDDWENEPTAAALAHRMGASPARTAVLVDQLPTMTVLWRLELALQPALPAAAATLLLADPEPSVRRAALTGAAARPAADVPIPPPVLLEALADPYHPPMNPVVLDRVATDALDPQARRQFDTALLAVVDAADEAARRGRRRVGADAQLQHGITRTWWREAVALQPGASEEVRAAVVAHALTSTGQFRDAAQRVVLGYARTGAGAELLARLGRNPDPHVLEALAQNPAQAPAARPVSPLVELAARAAERARNGALPDKPTGWAELLPRASTEPYVYAPELAEADGQPLPAAPGYTVHLMRHEVDLHRNAARMRNCTFGYRADMAEGSGAVLALDTADGSRLNAHIVLEAGRWVPGEINSYRNEGRVPDPAYRGVEALCEQLNAALDTAGTPTAAPAPEEVGADDVTELLAPRTRGRRRGRRGGGSGRRLRQAGLPRQVAAPGR